MALKLLSNGRWRNLETGRYSKAPVEVSPGRFAVDGKPVEVEIPAYKSIVREYQATRVETPTAALVTPAVQKSSIISGEDFLAKYGNLPPMEYSSSKALSFKRGVVNRCVPRGTPRANQIKIRKMDAAKLLKLYEENPTLFDVYFSYNDDAFGLSGYFEENDGDISDLLIEKYEAKYGVIN